MKETVLLTGGAGFIGSHIAVELLQRDYDVVIADDLSNSRPDVPERIEKITGRAPVFYRMDVSDRQALDRVFRAHDIAAAVHLAGYKAVGESVQKPLAYYRNNLDTTLALLEVMADHGVHRLIFSSSATVYGNAEPPCREDMPTGGCTNPYAWTKLMIEQILRDAAKAWDGKDPKKLEDDLKTLQTKYDTDTANIRRDAAIDLALTRAHARDPQLTRAALSMDDIKIGADGKVTGLDAQLETLKKDKAWLFEEDGAGQPGKQGSKGGNPNGGQGGGYNPQSGGNPNTVNDLGSALAEVYNTNG